jgi:hypothetical protein
MLKQASRDEKLKPARFEALDLSQLTRGSLVPAPGKLYRDQREASTHVTWWIRPRAAPKVERFLRDSNNQFGNLRISFVRWEFVVPCPCGGHSHSRTETRSGCETFEAESINIEQRLGPDLPKNNLRS